VCSGAHLTLIKALILTAAVVLVLTASAWVVAVHGVFGRHDVWLMLPPALICFAMVALFTRFKKMAQPHAGQ
jgi:hypothetical protein